MFSPPPPVQRFQSTHPMRGATTSAAEDLVEYSIFQSTHPMRGATTFCRLVSTDGRISIHAPHEGCDHYSDFRRQRNSISIHAPHEGCDTSLASLLFPGWYFNPRTP